MVFGFSKKEIIRRRRNRNPKLKTALYCHTHKLNTHTQVGYGLGIWNDGYMMLWKKRYFIPKKRDQRSEFHLIFVIVFVYGVYVCCSG